MADMISPGVYTNIIDLSTYLTSTSGSIGFCPIITEKGEDNVLVRLTSFQEYIEKFGEPDIRTFGKYYGCGPYIVAQHMSVSSDMFVIRALPDDATYAHAFIYFREVADFPEEYQFDKKFKAAVGATDAQIEQKYAGSHVGLGCFSVTPKMEYPLDSDIKVKVSETTSVDTYTEVDKETTDPDSEVTYYTKTGDTYSAAQNATTTELVWADDSELYVVDANNNYTAVDKTTTDPVAGTTYYTQDGNDYVEEVDATTTELVWATAAVLYTKSTTTSGELVEFTGKTYTLAKAEQTRKQAIAAGAAFDVDGNPVTDSTAWQTAVVTNDESYAEVAYAPKMSNTQLLDSLFVGNDNLINAAIEETVEATTGVAESDIYKDKAPHKCVLAYVRAVGRGDYYNSLSIKITSDANPSSFGIYKFQVFELQDGADTLVESFNVSFDPNALDADGESCYFADVVNKFSSRIRVEANADALPIMTKKLKEFYVNDPTIKDITEDYIDEEFNELGELTKGFPVAPTWNSDDATIDNELSLADLAGFGLGYKAKAIWFAYLNQAYADKQEDAATALYNEALELDDDDETKDDKLQAAIDALTLAEDMQKAALESYEWATSRNLMNMVDSDPVTSGEQPFALKQGSIGSLVTKYGNVNPKVGNQILYKAYTGLLKNPVIVKKVDESTGSIKYSQQYTDNVYDLDWIYFNIVYDPGYKSDVKQAALTLVDTYRRDCVLISDCGDNSDYNECLKYVGAVQGGADVRPWNTYLAARYEPYSRVYDVYTGKDIWVSPVYHMAKLLPQTDKLYECWYATAGFTRGNVSEIKELRYSCNKAQRDLMYMAQVNPIVHFPEGMIVWGQLTTQKKNSTLSDLNCVRCVLYIKRALEQYCKNFIFDHNDQDTWARIQSGISPFLETVKAKRGLKSYSVSVGATDYEYKTKTCHVNVMLEPLKVLEKIQLNMYIS